MRLLTDMGARHYNRHYLTFTAGQAGCVLFVVFTIIAMLAYPGGTYNDHYTEGYSFWHNFFSDLGRTESFLGGPNTLSFLFFTAALSLGGLVLVVFFFSFRVLFRQEHVNRIISSIGSAAGVITGISFVGVAVTPWDILLVPHLLFVFIAFTAYLVAVIVYTVAIIRSNDYPNTYAWVMMVFVVLLLIYNIIMFSVGRDSPETLVIQSAAQKIIVYASIVVMFIQAAGAKRMLKQSAANTTTP